MIAGAGLTTVVVDEQGCVVDPLHLRGAQLFWPSPYGHSFGFDFDLQRAPGVFLHSSPANPGVHTISVDPEPLGADGKEGNS